MFCPQQSRLYSNEHHCHEAKTEPVIARDDWAQQNVLYTCMNTQGVLGSHPMSGAISPCFPIHPPTAIRQSWHIQLGAVIVLKQTLKGLFSPVDVKDNCTDAWGASCELISAPREDLQCVFFFFSKATAAVLYGVLRKLCALAALTHSGCNWVWQVDICWQRWETGA